MDVRDEPDLIRNSLLQTHYPPIFGMVGFGECRRLKVAVGPTQQLVEIIQPEYIRERSRMIMYGIDARHQRYPDETRFDYQPLHNEADLYRWSPDMMAKLKDYNLKDLAI